VHVKRFAEAEDVRLNFKKNSSHLIQIWRVLVNCIHFFSSKLLYRMKIIFYEIYQANHYVIN
jgi:hypothetical protein